MGTTLTYLKLDPHIEPWEQQPGESKRRYDLFCTYLELGLTRKVTKVAEKVTLSPGYLKRVSASGLWLERAHAYNAHLHAEQRARMFEKRMEIAEQDAQLVSAALGKATQALTKLKPEDFSASDTIRWLDLMLKHRRALFPDPDEQPVAMTTTLVRGTALTGVDEDFAAMSVAQKMIEIQRLAAVAARRAQAASDELDDDA